MCLDVVNFISYGVSKVDDDEFVNFEVLEEVEVGEEGGLVLSKYVIDLNCYVKDGKIDLLIGCDLEVECII